MFLISEEDFIELEV